MERDMPLQTQMIVALETKSHWTVFLELDMCKVWGEDQKVRNPGFS